MRSLACSTEASETKASTGLNSSSSTMRNENVRSCPRLVPRRTSTGIMRGVLPRRPAMAVVRSCSMVPTGSPGTLIFQDW